MLNNWNEVVWSRFSWLRIGTNGVGSELSGSIIWRGISLLPDKVLAFQEEFCYMDLAG
jgi:hypothetical protein